MARPSASHMIREQVGQFLIGGSAVICAYVLAPGLPPRTLFYTVVPDPVFCSEQQNSGPGAEGPLGLLIFCETKTLADKPLADMLARALRRFAAL